MLDQQHVFERDDGRFEVGLVDPAGPFESRTFAEAVAQHRNFRAGVHRSEHAGKRRKD